MSTLKKLALIAAGYVVAVCGGLAAVAVNEWLMPEDISQTSGGMVAFGDMILFFLVTGLLGLVPTLFLLKLCADKAPRILVAAVFLLAAMGPLSWLALVNMARGFDQPNHPPAVGQLLGLFIAFAAIPRMVFGPVLLVIEAVTFFLVRGRVARGLLVVAMLMDLIPLGMFALHMARGLLLRA